MTIAGIFPIGDTGEEFVIAEWYPDPAVVKQELLKLADDVENWNVPLQKAKEAFIYNTEYHFQSESDPYDRPWTPLEPGYADRKARRDGYSGGILEREGHLRAAATSQAAWITTERDILFNVEAIPFYGPYHQVGTMDKMTQQILHKLRQPNNPKTGLPYQKNQLTDEEARYSYPDAGRGKNLPQRMFIGADETTIDEVERIFIDWLNGLVDVDLPDMPTGFYTGGEYPVMRFLTTGQPLLRTPSGPRFGRK